MHVIYTFLHIIYVHQGKFQKLFIYCICQKMGNSATYFKNMNISVLDRSFSNLLQTLQTLQNVYSSN